MLLRRSFRSDAEAKPLDFIIQHPVFRAEELEAAYRQMGRSPESAGETLAYHVKQGRLWNVRRGVYAHTTAVDPWLVASKLVGDAVISHDGALSFHGLTGLGRQLSFMTACRTSVVRFNDVVYPPFRVPKSRLQRGVQLVEREGQELVVTTLSITLVDCLAQLHRGPPPLELMALFKKARPRLDLGAMIHHALWFQSPLLASRLGFFLSCAKCDIPARDLQQLNQASLPAPAYFLRSARTKSDAIISRWNLIVPPKLRECWPTHG